MAHITEFTIEGLAGRTNPYSQKLHPDTNVFFGLNGAGKTSLLRILESALSRNSATVQNVPFERAEVKVYSVEYNREFTHILEKSHPKTLKRDPKRYVQRPSPERDLPQGHLIISSSSVLESHFQLEQVPWHISPTIPKDSSSRGIWRHGWLPTSRLYFGNLPAWRLASAQQQFLTEEVLDRLFAEALSSLWSSYSNQVLSEVRKVQERGLSDILQTILMPAEVEPAAKPLDATIVYDRITTFLRRQGAEGKLGSLEAFKARYVDDPKLVSVAGHIDRVETEIESASQPRVRLENLIHRLFSGPKEIQFTDTSIRVVTKDGDDIGLASLSSGEKHILRIFTEVLLYRESTIIVDEPEISLHIDWQRELIKSMRTLNPYTQFILATHSPEIMADLEDSHIFSL